MPASSPTNTVACFHPGHGGTDPGAAYTYTAENHVLHERDLTLQIGGIVRNKLTSHGYQFIMTRDPKIARSPDPTLSNPERAEIFNGSDLNGTNPDNLAADAAISIHLNASCDTSIDCFQDSLA